jgi:hypothetical protein
MQAYVNQLLEMLQEAHSNRPAPRYLGLSEEMECLRDVIDLDMSLEEDEHTMESIFGLPQMYFPPENRLSDSQIKQITGGILDLWRVFHYEAETRKGEFTDREIYTKLVDCWKKHFPLFRGTNGTWHIELYDYEQNWDEESKCYVSDEEYFAKHNLNDIQIPDDGEEQPF